MSAYMTGESWEDKDGVWKKFEITVGREDLDDVLIKHGLDPSLPLPPSVYYEVCRCEAEAFRIAELARRGRYAKENIDKDLAALAQRVHTVLDKVQQRT